MSQELTSARRALSRVSSDLKQGRHISAATAVRDGARLFGRVPMMRNESDEFITLLRNSCDALRYDREISKIFPLAITYTPGQEGALMELMNELIEALQLVSTEDAIRKHQEKKASELAKAREELEKGALDEARKTLAGITGEYEDDPALASDAGECFMYAGLYEDAAHYLGKAALLEPSAHLFNRLGIAFRKMSQFDKAEKHFLHALELESADSNLWFNLGRLYLDRKEWDKARKCGERALSLSPDFEEAAKLAAYAQKQSGGKA
ncbi:tetratricopeptide repeat protein [Desulfovibrio sp. OttesenSCG-928-A18]|nr:tetratricopeptide repeat protein [Desulfovibrio sp. OttesenSCG-928-A18]